MPCTGGLARMLESEACSWHVQCGGDGAKPGLGRRGDAAKAADTEVAFCSSAVDGPSHNRISSVPTRKTRQLQSQRHKGRTACKRFLQGEM